MQPATPSVSPSLDPSNILTLDEVAQRLKVNPRWVYERTRKRSADPIPFTKFGKKTLRFDWAAVSAWWMKNSSGGAA
jgi:excisionase family DNA binding protein